MDGYWQHKYGQYEFLLLFRAIHDSNQPPNGQRHKSEINEGTFFFFFLLHLMPKKKEHLGMFYRPEMEFNVDLLMDTWEQIATINDKKLRAGGALVGRPVFMVPTEKYEWVLKRIFYPNR